MNPQTELQGYGTHLRDGMKVNLRFVRKKTVANGVARYDEVVYPGAKPVLNSIYIQGWADPKTKTIVISIKTT